MPMTESDECGKSRSPRFPNTGHTTVGFPWSFLRLVEVVWARPHSVDRLDAGLPFMREPAGVSAK